MSTGPLKRDGQNGVIAYPKKIITAYANGAITAGDVVKVEITSGEVPDPDTYGFLWIVEVSTLDSPLACGVALNTVADGEDVQVQVAGYNQDITGGEAIAVGRVVNPGVGTVMDYNAEGALAEHFGVCVVAFTTNPAVNYTDGAILINDKGWFG